MVTQLGLEPRTLPVNRDALPSELLRGVDQLYYEISGFSAFNESFSVHRFFFRVKSFSVYNFPRNTFVGEFAFYSVVFCQPPVNVIGVPDIEPVNF